MYIHWKNIIKFLCSAPTNKCYRETADEKKIVDTHRKIMILNHPDNGGSTYVATKVNEAKELLMSGKAASGK